MWAVLRACVTESGGHEVEARADEYFAAFEAPRAAVDAAVAAQHRLRDHRWPADADVRVRIGIHSGYPTSTPTNYVGIDVNTTSRICAAGHGGQIVVSANTREAVRASVPGGIRFLALGPHHLRGVPEPVAAVPGGRARAAGELPGPASDLTGGRHGPGQIGGRGTGCSCS